MSRTAGPTPSPSAATTSPPRILAERIAAGLSPNSQNPATFYPDTDEELSVGYTDYPTRDTASLSG